MKDETTNVIASIMLAAVAMIVVLRTFSND
jgi:hypothetical protein